MSPPPFSAPGRERSVRIVVYPVTSSFFVVVELSLVSWMAAMWMLCLCRNRVRSLSLLLIQFMLNCRMLIVLMVLCSGFIAVLAR